MDLAGQHRHIRLGKSHHEADDKTDDKHEDEAPAVGKGRTQLLSHRSHADIGSRKKQGESYYQHEGSQ